MLFTEVTLVFGAGSAEKQSAGLLTKAPDDFQVLVHAAQREGQLNVIALPHDWMNFGEVISAFSQKYGIRVNELNPDETPAGEIKALRTSRERAGPQAPDVVDMDLMNAAKAKAEGLLSPYKVAAWDTIPAAFKDTAGYWCGGYYGVLTFEVNANVIATPPLDWLDLLRPEFNGKIALAGDPHESAVAIMSICAASIASGGTFDDPQPGLDFFGDLNARGNFVPLIAVPETVKSGATPVTIRWDYDSFVDEAAGGRPRIRVIVPASGVVGCIYAQGISAAAPHPLAARLWMEFLFSDEGQLMFLKGRGHPARYADLEARGVIPPAVAALLPPAFSMAVPHFPTTQQEATAREFVTKYWNEAVTRESALHPVTLEEATVVEMPAAAEKGGSGVELGQFHFDDVFPVLYKYYDDHPIGSAIVENHGDLPAEKVTIELIVKGFMTEKKLCQAIDRLDPGETRQVSLYGLFTEDVLKLTEGTKALVNVSIGYSAGGSKNAAEHVHTLRFLKRNNMSWEDDRRAAAFVTANDPAIMKFAKMTAGVVASSSIKAVNDNLQKVIGIHEALKLFGMSYVVDPNSSYAVLSRTRTAIDFLQFPSETLDYKAGDCDDLSILHCALLEAIGVETAFVTIPGHIFVAASLKLKPDEARRVFQRPDQLIFLNDVTWLPVEVTDIQGGFNKAWQSAATEWLLHKARGEAKLIPLHDAWQLYEPVAFSSATLSSSYPEQQSVAKMFKDELDGFIQQELSGRVAALQAVIEENPRNQVSVNTLGVLYARYGLVELAARTFARILETDEFLPALVNMGHLLFLNRDYKSALGFYERARKVNPRSDQALLAAARANHELENYGAVRDIYADLRAVNHIFRRSAPGYLPPPRSPGKVNPDQSGSV